MKKDIIIVKQNGEKELFNMEKVRASIKRSGANSKITNMVCADLVKKIKNEMTTSKIYEIVRRDLKKYSDKKSFLRYNLPLAISKMGPEGFAFESFIGEVFKSYDYAPVIVGKKILGKCIVHEMDIVAEKRNEKVTAELKFHNSRSKKTDLKVALYMKARFDDILNSGYYGDKIPKQLIITNTKFTTNAKIYAKCSGIGVLSWNFPENNNLHDFILKSGVHPLTALTSISNKAKEFFIKKKIVTCRDLVCDNRLKIQKNPYIHKKDFEKVEKEIKEICEVAKEIYSHSILDKTKEKE